VLHRLAEIRTRVGLGELETAQQSRQLSLTRRRSNVVPDLVVEHDETRGITLIVNGQVKQRCRDEPRIVHLADLMRAVFHRLAGVEQHGQQAVGFPAVPFQICALGSGEHVPIDVTQIVTRRVGAIFSKLLRETKVRRTMQARHEPIDDRLGDEIQTGNPGQHMWV
jgi:hypothetical protein